MKANELSAPTIDRVYDQFCKRRFPAASKSQVAKLERKLKVRFPDHFREFLVEYNGGLFAEPKIVFAEPITIDFRGQKVAQEMDRLSGLHGIQDHEESYSLGAGSDIRIFDNNDPLQLLKIGDTRMGSLLLLDFAEETYGQILIKFPFEYAYGIATSIDQLFDLITIDQ